MRFARTVSKCLFGGTLYAGASYLNFVKETPFTTTTKASMADGCPPPKGGPKSIVSKMLAQIWVFSDKNGNPLTNGFLTPEGYFIGFAPEQIPSHPPESFTLRQLSDDSTGGEKVLSVKLLGADPNTRILIGKVDLSGVDLPHSLTKPEQMRADKVNIGEKVFLVGADSKLQIELTELLVLQHRVKNYFGLKGTSDEDIVKEPTLHSFRTNCKVVLTQTTILENRASREDSRFRILHLNWHFHSLAAC